MSGRNSSVAMFGALLALSLLLAHAPQTEADSSYTYYPKMNTLILISSTLRTSSQTTPVTVSIAGLPADLSTAVSVDGKQAVNISGGGSKTFDLDKTVPHIFLADPQVNGACSSYEGKSVCTRYRCADHRWTVDVSKTESCQTVPVCVRIGIRLVCTYEQQCQTTLDLKEKAHTFAYVVENQLIVSDVNGEHVDKWYGPDSDVSVSAEESVVTKDQNFVRERDVFLDWVVNGVRVESRILTFKMDKPYYIRAEYRTETQYRVVATSEFGHPATDNPTGWYMKGQQATVSVEKEVPAEGWLGTLGGRMAFVAWRNPKGIQSETPTFTLTVEDPTILRAEWRTDYTQPIAIIAVVVVLILGGLVFTLYKTGRLRKRGTQSEAQAQNV